MNKFQDKNVAIIGAGVEGLASADWLLKQGAKVTILDSNANFNQSINNKVNWILGSEYLKTLNNFEIIVRSPGIKLNLPELIAAKEAGIEITSQTKIFFDLCPSPIIGVTGTKGKGTTSALIYEMLKKQGLDAYLGGNIGVPPLTFLDKLNPTAWVVLELSSFQLEDLEKSPHISVILMIVSEHLGKDDYGTQNYHETMEEYVNAKRNLVKFQTKTDFAVINRDYPASNESDIHTEAKIYQISREREASGDGCFIRQGRLIVSKDGKEEELIESDEILLPGKHNLENICAAVMAADLAGISKSSIATVLRSFKGLEHRLQLVNTVGGVRYFDDSFSTTPETAIAAIEAFSDPEILILGGSSKGSDFTQLGEIISTRVNIRAIIGIGAEWPRIKEKIKLNNNLKIIEGCKDMEEVVKKAAEVSEVGDVVLLTPACASFGMFNNYKERGELFSNAVKKLP